MPKIIWDEQLKKFVVGSEIKKEEMKKAEGIVPFADLMQIRKIYGGLPIYTTSTGINSKVGEIYLVKAGSSFRFCARFEGITKSSSLT